MVDTTYLVLYNKLMLKNIEFEWDQWNIQKNELKHGVSSTEAESCFFDASYLLVKDLKHSVSEKRFILLGWSSERRVLLIGFTLRQRKIRIITARPASRKERSVYEEAKKN